MMSRYSKYGCVLEMSMGYGHAMTINVWIFI